MAPCNLDLLISPRLYPSLISPKDPELLLLCLVQVVLRPLESDSRLFLGQL